MRYCKFTAVVLIAAALTAIPLLSAFAQDDMAGQDSSSQGDVSVKLEQVLKNQKTILDEIAALRQELNIVKIRVTQQQ